MKKKISITINQKILRDIDSIVDNIFIQNRSQAIEYLIKESFKKTKVAVILHRENNNNIKKYLKKRYSLAINGSSIIERGIRKLSDEGFRKIFIVSDNKSLTNIFNIIGNGSAYKTTIEYVKEEKQEGTASSLKSLRGKIKTSFLLVQSDLVFDKVDLKELWQDHLKERNITTMLICSSITPKAHTYGYVNLHGNKILTYVEKPKKGKQNTTIFFGGILVAEPEIFNYPGKSLELDIFPELAKRRLLGGVMSAQEHLHIHSKEDLSRVRKFFSK